MHTCAGQVIVASHHKPQTFETCSDVYVSGVSCHVSVSGDGRKIRCTKENKNEEMKGDNEKRRKTSGVQELNSEPTYKFVFNVVVYRVIQSCSTVLKGIVGEIIWSRKCK
jgi:hypothetical protein